MSTQENELDHYDKARYLHLAEVLDQKGLFVRDSLYYAKRADELDDKFKEIIDLKVAFYRNENPIISPDITVTSALFDDSRIIVKEDLERAKRLLISNELCRAVLDNEIDIFGRYFIR